MTSKLRASKPTENLPEAPPPNTAAAVPAAGWLDRILARLKTLKGAIVAPHAYLAMAYARKADHARSRAAIAALLRVDPKFSLSKLDAPKAGYPVAYLEFWETKLLPAGRLAGLPE